VEIRTEFDADVVRYIHDIYVEGARVDMPEVAKRMAGLLRGSLDDIIADLKARGFLTYKPMVNIRDLLATQADISRRLRARERNGALYYAATQVALGLKINHALVLVETQGIGALRNYFAKLEEEGAKPDAGRASRRLPRIPKVAEAMKIARVVQPNDPKVAKAIEVVTQQLADKPGARTIVFAQFRDTAETLVRELGQVPGLRPVRFVGQATRGKDVGLSQREQAEIIDGFRSGKHNILVSSSVGEEGLDIPQVDLVVFYEPVPSEIRTIQRRGRTGRARPGRVVVLLSRDTRDEAYLSSAKRKERRMHLELDRLRKQLKQRIFVGEVGGRAFAAPTEAGEAGYKSLEAALTEEVAPQPSVSKRKGQASLGDYQPKP
jgi:Fanconi anemia group M protein